MKLDHHYFIEAGFQTIVLFIAHALSNPLEQIVVQGNNWGWALLFFWYMLWFLAADVVFNYLEAKLK